MIPGISFLQQDIVDRIFYTVDVYIFRIAGTWTTDVGHEPGVGSNSLAALRRLCYLKIIFYHSLL